MTCFLGTLLASRVGDRRLADLMRILLFVVMVSVFPSARAQTMQDEHKTIEITFPETEGWVGVPTRLKQSIEWWSKTKPGDASLELIIGFTGRNPPNWERYLADQKAADERFKKSKVLLRSGEILVGGRKGYLRALIDSGYIDSLNVSVQVPTNRRIYSISWRGRISDDPSPDLAEFLDSVKFLPLE